MSPQFRVRTRQAVDRVAGAALGSISGSRTSEGIALTLDDGPDPEVTPKIIDILASQESNATFFLLVSAARREPEIARALLAAGHEIGLHGLDHRPVRGMTFRESIRYLRESKDALEDLVQTPIALYRPTFGAQSMATYLAARRVGLDVVVWTTDVADWEPRSTADVVADALKTPRGGILLFHDRLDGWQGRPTAAATGLDRPRIVAEVIAGWRAEGIRVCSVAELTSSGGSRRTTWFRP